MIFKYVNHGEPLNPRMLVLVQVHLLKDSFHVLVLFLSRPVLGTFLVLKNFSLSFECF